MLKYHKKCYKIDYLDEEMHMNNLNAFHYGQNIETLFKQLRFQYQYSSTVIFLFLILKLSSLCVITVILMMIKKYNFFIYSNLLDQTNEPFLYFKI